MEEATRSRTESQIPDLFCCCEPEFHVRWYTVSKTLNTAVTTQHSHVRVALKSSCYIILTGNAFKY